MARKALEGLLVGRDDIHLTEIEILTNPLRSLKDGVKFIPTLQCGEEQLTGIFLDNKSIKAFLNRVTGT